jgi:hypothetical protein
VGIKCAEFLSPRFGRPIYYVYAALALFTFSFVSVFQAQIVMTIVGGILLLINCYGIFRLRHEISYELGDVPVTESVQEQAQVVHDNLESDGLPILEG